MTDKTVAELMALADAYAGSHASLIACGESNWGPVKERAALEQAIRRALEWGEPVAEVGPAWSLVYVGSAPVAEICRNHPGLRIGTPLYARNKP